jgi:hypothetical protein
MGAFIDFLAGRTNKLLRDMLAAAAVVAFLCVVAVSLIDAAVTTFTASRHPLPPRLAAGQGYSVNGPVTTIVRSVLDDPITTGTIGAKSGVIDPRTGKEKR